jgi:3-hydroxy-9,10-secoandrosta-1,3,5(10)-triene-9,17-dione monooxygenase reductase component
MVVRPDEAPIGAERTDPASLRRVLGHFCTGVVVVTAIDRGEPVGMTCQSFSSLSLDPPLVLFSASHSSTSWPRIRAAGSFAVNILAVQQERVSRVFAATGTDKFAEVEWTPGLLGAPLLAGCVAHVECRLESVYPGGDHDIVIGAPLALREDPAHGPLLFFRSGYGRFEA